MPSSAAKYIIIVGLIITFLGLTLFFFKDAFNWVGRLPGDVKFEKGNFKFYFPIVTMIVISLALTIIINLIKKLF